MRRSISAGLMALTLALASAACSAGKIETLAGTGQKGFSGDGGPAAKAQLNNPFGLTRGPDGALYVCDTDNHLIRRIDKAGVISTVAGTGKRGYSGDGGPATKAELNEPYEIRFDPAGNMVFVEMKNAVVRKVDAKTGVISTLAGTGIAGFSGDGGPANKAQFNQPHSIQFDKEGNLFICDIANHRIRKFDGKTGNISTFAGTGAKTATPDGSPFASATLNGPRAIDFDKEGNMWLALREGNAIYKLDLKAGTVHHVAGSGKKGFSAESVPAKQAGLSGPKGVSIGPDGTIYFTDTESHSVRKIDLKKQTVELVAGTGQKGDGPEGDPANCKLTRPHGVFVDADGAVYIGDSENHRVQVVR